MSSGLDAFREEATVYKDLLLKQYNLVLEEGPLRLQGVIPLLDNENRTVDSYRIKIIPYDDYPQTFPFVYELNDRLPHNIDWHIYSDGHFCIKSVAEELLICSNGISLISFISSQLVPFLFAQKFREQYGYFLNERTHGNAGNIEAIRDIFKTKNLKSIQSIIKFILKNKSPKRTDLCFCGSGIKYRKCHRNLYQQAHTMPRKVISKYLQIINYALQTNN